MTVEWLVALLVLIALLSGALFVWHRQPRRKPDQRPGQILLDSMDSDRLMQQMLEADIGVATAERLLEAVQTVPAHERKGYIRAAIHDRLHTRDPNDLGALPRPVVIMVVGVNGTGKTTSIGKMSGYYRAKFPNRWMIAGDTFRAAAVDQIAEWANRTGATCYRGGEGALPSAVVYDGMQAALAAGADLIFVDTAGRLHTNAPLMDELRKTKRVMEKLLPGSPHEVWITLDSTYGQNSFSQVCNFHATLTCTGVVLTKFDGTSKAGAVIGLSEQFKLPVLFVGVGEKVTDIKPFQVNEYVDRLFG